MNLKQIVQIEVIPEAESEIKSLCLKKQFEKQRNLFIANPAHPSLDFKPLKGKLKGLYSFRINQKYRVRLIKLDRGRYQIFQAGDFH